MLLSADDATPARPEKESLGVAGTRFTYAIGTLVLWSPKPGAVDAQGEVLKKGAFAHIALANPRLARLHSPIRQDATVLTGGKDNPAARALMNYLKQDNARAIIKAYGYR